MLVFSCHPIPDFIELQSKTIKRFLNNPEFIVFDDSNSDLVKKTCLSLNLRCISVPQSNRSHCSSVRHAQAIAHALQWIDDNIKEKIIMLLDSDIFPTRSFSPEKYIQGYDIAGVYQSRGIYDYIWPGLVIIDRETINIRELDFMPCAVEGTRLDTGGKIYYFLQGNNVKVKWITHSCPPNWKPETLNLPEEISDYLRKDYIISGRPFAEAFLNTFIHLQNGTNWANIGHHQSRIDLLKNHLEDLLSK